MSKLLSIIMPVYNVERYLKECLDSIVNQTYTYFELLAVNDGSTDGSLQILQSYAKRDPRIKVIDQKNSGAGAARNVALKKMQGDYVAFVDSDDYILPTMFQELISAIENEDADIAGCDLSLLYKDRMISPKEDYNKEIYNKIEFLKKTTEAWKHYICCNKVFKSKLVAGIFFPEGNAIDDKYFTYKIFARANKTVLLHKNLYIYRQRKSSVMFDKAKEMKRCANALQIYKILDIFYKKNFKEVYRYNQVKLIDCYIETAKRYKEDEKLVKNIAKYLRKNCKRTVHKMYKTKEKIWILLFIRFPMKMIKNSSMPKVQKSDKEFFE